MKTRIYAAPAVKGLTLKVLYKHDNNRFLFVLLADHITVIVNEVSIYTSGFANVWYQIKQI